MRQELTADQLRRRFDPSRFAFKSTADAPDLDGIIGQGRGSARHRVRARNPLPGLQRLRHRADRRRKNEHHHALPARQGSRPARAARLGLRAQLRRARTARLRCDCRPGGGLKLRDQVNALLVQVAEVLEKLFVSDQYVQSRNALSRQLDQLRGDQFKALDATVREQGFVLGRKDDGFMLTPVKDGQPLTPEQYEALPEARARCRSTKKARRSRSRWSGPSARCRNSKRRRVTGSRTWTARLPLPSCSRCSTGWRRSTADWPTVTAT